MGVCIAIMAICAQVAIPMPFGVPFTLQTLAISLCGVMLGAKKGTVATVAYVLVGFVGLPVFAHFGGGVAVVFGRTGGFILSFPILAFMAGIGARRGRVWFALCLVLGAAANYMGGLLMFSFVTGNTLWVSFTFVVAPFLAMSALEVALLVCFGQSFHRLTQPRRKGALK